MQVSVFSNATTAEPAPVSPDFASVIKLIMNGAWQKKIEYLRTLDKSAYDEAKKKLPAITWSGTFSRRNASAIINYTQYIVLDIDHIEGDALAGLKTQLSQDEYVCFAFVSPSNKGLKILVKVNQGPEQHLASFLHLQNYFENKYCFKVDDSGKDICRLCFVSYDPEAINKVGKVFEVDTKYGVVGTYTQPQGLMNLKASRNLQFIYETCVKWVENKFSYVQGQRNAYVHAVACALNRCGVAASDAESILLNNYNDLEEKEVRHCTKSAYFHNSSEHGTVEVKDIGGLKTFKAPPYVQNYTDDVVLNDLMRITALLHHHKLVNSDILDVVGKVAKYYKKEGLIDLDRKGLVQLMNESIKLLKQKVVEATDSLTLEYQAAENVGKEIIKIDVKEGSIPTTFGGLDAIMRGGMSPGNFYGIIGVGGTYKSILAQFWAVAAASLDKPVLYLNGEMSKMQFYERLVSIILKVNLYQEMSQKRVHEGNIDEAITEMNTVLKNNLFLVNGTGFGEEAILATIANIEATTGKKIAAVFIDGVTQMDNMGKEEIPAAISNTAICKTIAKKAHDGNGVVVVGLMHVSGEQSGAKIRRDNGPFCRGGGKTIANMDGYFSTSLLVDPATNDLDASGEIIFLEDKLYLRYVDKRSGAGTVNAIINIGPHIELVAEDCDPRSYEVKIKIGR